MGGAELLKWVVPQKKFYRLNLMFCIIMGFGVWYSSLWSEGPKKHLNLKILVGKFVPRNLEGRRT